MHAINPSVPAINPSLPALHHTRDLYLAAFLIGKRLAKLRAITGTRGERVFEFDRPVDPRVLLDFHGSDEKAVLDAYKSLKAAMFTG
jgi:hypothetical protein